MAVVAGDLPRPERMAADLGGRLCFGDESGQGLRPPRPLVLANRDTLSNPACTSASRFTNYR
jgi:hypothetical protein